MNQTKSDFATPLRNIWTPAVAAWQLAKVPLCLLIGCSTGFGAALALHPATERIVYLGFGVMLVAMAGATVNSLQERDIDRHLQRTASRPLVRKSVSGRFAILQALLLLVAGILLLTMSAVVPALVVTLALLSLFIYNCIYTRLKQKTVMAIIPGAICGALPPVIGWVGGGGPLFSHMAALLFVLLFLWQIPHFCLVLLLHKEEYLAVSQPSFIQLFAEQGVRRLSAVWICGLALVMMLFTLHIPGLRPWQTLLVTVNALTLAGVSAYQLLSRFSVSYRKLFVFFNIMLGNHMLILAVAHIAM